MQTHQKFLEKEYQKLWEFYGIEDIKLKPYKKTFPDKKTTPKKLTLPLIQEELGNCKRCALCKTRNKIVFGDGNPKAKLFFVGEGPGRDEDEQGIPFVGRAGQLLTKIIEAMKLKREDVYIANIVKCRPPDNRVPLPEETETCSPFLKAQISVVKPHIIVALGATATAFLTQSKTGISALRGRFHPLPWDNEIFVMPTFHPAYLLRNPPAKSLVWEDMKIVLNKLKTL